MDCKEFYLDDFMAVAAIPIANIPLSVLSYPANQLSPTISNADITSSMLAGAITIGVVPAYEDGIVVPIVRRTGKAKDDESDSVAGRLHTVTVSCEIDERDPSVWSHLLTLERTPAHLLLMFRGGARAFVSATEDTYLCSVGRDGAKTTVTFKVHNLMGLQMLV